MDLKAYITSGMLELYVLGLASEKESREVERLAEEHPELKKEISTIRKALDEYAKLHGVHPPEEVRAALDKHLDAPPEADAAARVPKAEKKKVRSTGKPFVVQWSHMVLLAAVLMAVAAIGMGVLAFDYSDRLDAATFTNSELKEDLSKVSSELVEVKKENTSLKERLGFLSSINTRQVRLNATRRAKGATVLIYWNDDQERAFVQWEQLPELPEGMKYRLWAVARRNFEPLADMETTSSPTSEIQQIVFVPGASSFVVTMEKSNGPDYPDLSRMYLQGSLN